VKLKLLRKSRPNNHSKTKRQSGKQETVGHSVLFWEEKMTESKIQLVMVTGMSGAGKTVAIQSFEDLGYFTIDNMPPALLLKFIELNFG